MYTKREFLEPGVIRADWWHLLDDGRIQCDLCPRRCKMHDGQHGFCFIRGVRNNQLELSSYGRASGFCIDPIEKKPLNHFYPGTSVLSFGTAGCNLGCKFCQNWNISKAKKTDRLNQWAAPRDIVKAAAKNKCKSIAFTYNDPVIFAEYAIDCAIEARKSGIKTVAVTAGYISPEARNDFFKHMDAANIDLKAFSDQFYKKLCFAALEPVLETLAWVKNKTEVWVEITTLLIPGQNDSDEELKKLCGWLLSNLGENTPLHFTAFHPDFKLMHLPKTPSGTLDSAYHIAKQMGLQHVYLGNLSTPFGQNTYCGQCGKLLIGRDWYQLSQWNLLPNGECKNCGSPLPGHFQGEPGNWGARRQPIFI